MRGERFGGGGGQAGMRVAGLTANCDAMGSSLMLKSGIGGSGGGG